MAEKPWSGTNGTDPQVVGRGDPGPNDGVADGGSVAGKDAVVRKDGDAGNEPAAEAGNMAATEMDHAETDLLGAVISSLDVASGIDHTLDQLTTATDLFDVPALDFDDGLPT